VTRSIIEISRDELAGIFSWVRNHGEDPQRPVTVLVGGWAVYCYNPWYGSIDIDIITNNRTRQHLMKYLRDERGFSPSRHPVVRNTVEKHSPEGTILIDFGSRMDICRFEGRAEVCPFSLIDGQTVTGTVEIMGNLVQVNIPSRALLVLYKLKAAWDRTERLRTGTSPDPEWDEGKVRKDRADILALLDPAHGGSDIDVNYLGSKLAEYPFLFDVIGGISEDPDAVAMYTRLTHEQAREIVGQLISLIR